MNDPGSTIYAITMGAVVCFVAIAIAFSAEQQPDFYSNDTVYEDDSETIYLMNGNPNRHAECLTYIYDHGGEVLSETFVERPRGFHIEWRVVR